MTTPLLTPQINTLPAAAEKNPENLALETKIEEATLWNSSAMVHAAEFLQTEKLSLGGHTATPASISTIFLVGMLHHFREKDLIYFQGHSTPWLYGFHHLMGKLSADDLLGFRRLGGLPSYPHPFLCPDLWENATVSMGLGPLFGIFQAKFERYLETALPNKGNDVRVWVTLGDGEAEEPEVLGCARVAARYELDHLCFIVNANHQSLDGPVQANGSIIRELESAFAGMGWNVIKVLWGDRWDAILAEDADGKIVEWLNQVNDGTLVASIGLPAERAKEVLIDTAPGLPPALAKLSASDLQTLMRDRGGHCVVKIHQAMTAAEQTKGLPTVILAQTIKGYRIPGGEARYPNHKLIPNKNQMLQMAKDFGLELDLSQLEPPENGAPSKKPFFRFAEDSAEYQHLQTCRKKLDDKARIVSGDTHIPPPPSVESLRDAVRAKSPRSTTQIFNAVTRAILRNKDLREFLVPIMADEARTFGFDGFFPMGVWDPRGQNYFSAESEYNKVSYLRESAEGRIIQEGINEAGAISTFISAGRAWRTHGIPLIPVLMFYSQFFGRMYDQIWAGGDMLTRGFLLGCTAGTTTLNGEGLQHADGHTPHLADKIPPVHVYEMGYADAIAILTAEAFKKMLSDEPNAIYYIRLFNEKWQHQTVPQGWEEGVLKGGYPLAHWRDIEPQRYMRHPKERKGNLWASGPTLPLALEAQTILAERFDVLSNVYDITSYHALSRDAAACKRNAMLHPDLPVGKRQRPFIYDLIFQGEEDLPVIASMDASGSIPAMVAGHLRCGFDILTPSGWGRSGSREELRDFFEIAPKYMVARTLLQLNMLTAKTLRELDINPDKPWPGRTWPAGAD